MAVAVLAALAAPNPANAGCGCDKPPPPRAAIRPFVASPDQTVTLFNAWILPGPKYTVTFHPFTGTAVTVKGRVRTKRDLADGLYRTHLRVTLPALPFGPCKVTVNSPSGAKVMEVPATDFTVTSRPIPLADFHASMRRDAYVAGVGSDGTLYIPVDVKTVTGATHFWGQGFSLPLDFEAANIAMYNDQGYLMQLLDPTVPGLFELDRARGDGSSAALGYWRHEFRTYRQQHAQIEAFNVGEDDPDWHVGGTRHVNHDLIVIAIRGKLTTTGRTLAPGASPAFSLAVVAEAEER